MPFQIRANARCLVECGDLDDICFEEKCKYFLLFFPLTSTSITQNIEDNSKKILQIKKKNVKAFPFIVLVQ